MKAKDGVDKGEQQDTSATDEAPANPRDTADFSGSAQAAGALASALRKDAGIAAQAAARRMAALAAVMRQWWRDTSPGMAKGIAGTGQRLRGMGSIFFRAYPTGAGVQGRRRQWLLALATGAAVCVVAIALVLWWALRDVPWKEIADGSLRPVVVLESFDGEQIVSQGPFQAGYVPIEEFPQHLIDAVLSTEDRRFYEHSGIDLRGIARAFVSNVTAGEVVQGGSTITQQLVKILYLERDRTYKRKLQEAVIAFWLESRLTKDEILGRYLNNIYLGAGATGVPAAARVYFNKEVSELNLSESAMLAGIIRAPSHFSPTTNPEGARTRAATVLRTMVANGKLDNAEAEAAAAEYTELNITTPAARSGNWFADWVMDDARQIAGPYRGSIMVRTTLVPALQEIAERVVAEALDERGEEAGVSQAALVAMTPDGSVLAMVGGKDYAESEFNRAVDAMRQPGSTFKLFVYYAALKAGIGLRDRVVDEPIEIDGWTPENFGERYYGPVSIAEAFARSLNAATVALAMEVGIDNVIAAARELGIDAELVPTPALALGASEVSLLDLTAAYASVRAGVAPVEPWGITSFHASDQDRSFTVGPETQPATDLSQYQDELVRLLQLVVERGTGKAAAFGAFAAGKTGTSQNNRDAWFVGFSEPLVVGVWVGNDDDSPMNDVTGGNLPAKIWRNFMEEAIAGPPQASVSARAGDGSEQTATACNVRACQRAYRSFRASDCTFQPYDGPRRLCEK